MPKSRRFLLIDDSLIALKINAKLLEHTFEGCLINSYIDAFEALAFLEKNKDIPDNLPDTVLLDIIMPEIDGFEFIEKLEILFNGELPFKLFLLSSTLDEDDIARAEASKYVIRILNKPLDENLLKSLI